MVTCFKWIARLCNSGSAALFDVTTGQQLSTLADPDAVGLGGMDFGFSVAIDGNMAIVGAPKRGLAYLFDVTTGQELFQLTASDAAAYDLFGDSVGLSGDTAIVGALGSHSAYLFDVTTGQQLFKLTASDAAAGDQFGRSVAISGDTAIVGAYDSDPCCESGSAYLFDVTTGQELFQLTASDAAAGDFFGFSVAISGNTAIVGALDDDDAGLQSGSAYIFTFLEQPGDFNFDGVVDADDIDLLRVAIRTGSSRADYDVNGDLTLNDADFDHLIQVILGTAFGDGTLDGNVDASDLAAVRVHFGFGSGWAGGNFDLNLLVDAADLAVIRKNFGFSAAPLAVPTPEPAGVLLMIGGVLALCRRGDSISHCC